VVGAVVAGVETALAAAQWPVHPAGIAVAVASGGLLGLLVVTADDILDLLPPMRPA
jgi:hypothetical protein